MNELKPCPFCGKQPETRANFPYNALFTISCENKECKVHPYVVGKSWDEATTGWNCRTRPENKPLTLKRLRKIAESEEFGAHIWVNDIETGYIMAAITDIINGDGIIAIWDANNDWYKEKDYGKTWLAYTRKPEQEVSYEH